MSETWGGACPVAVDERSERVTLVHGEGGRVARRLIERRIVPRLGGELLAALGDSALLPAADGPLAFTTDSFVVSPLFFPGGNIGTLAVFGTVNDLAVAGARPRWLSVSLIVEEGLPLAVLDEVLAAMAAAARRADVEIVTGDTKVVPRGAADGLFINTAGIGQLAEPRWPGPAALRQGDALIVSGPIGRHGLAILSAREGLGFDPPPHSDCAPLAAATLALRAAGVPVRAARDATRGGAAAVLHEWAGQCGLSLVLDEALLPVSAEVRGAAELLGLDPLHVANEGTMLVAVPAAAADAALAVLRSVAETRLAARCGEVLAADACPVRVRRLLGSEQPLDEPAGAPLPRIC